MEGPHCRMEVGSVVVECLTMRKLLSVPLMALICGASWGADRPAEAASYAGGASTRCLPSSQCPGHIEYRLQRQTVLRPSRRAEPWRSDVWRARRNTRIERLAENA